jgi:hypothetical protein
MKNIYIVGAGQLGSRHLQALKSVSIQLQITIVDPSDDSLKIAKERYDSLLEGYKHNVTYLKQIPSSFSDADIVIIPSNSNVRKSIVETLLNNGVVKYMVLEKILFDKKEDYYLVNELFNKKNVKAWVNCSMRTMPFYYDLKGYFKGRKFVYNVTGSQYGLITNAIHYIDHMAYLSDNLDYEVDTSMLYFPPIQSKRKGFLELNGILSVKFSNGCKGIFTCFPDGNLPGMVEIISDNVRILSKEWEGKALISEEKESWRWKEIEAKIPFQSQMTAKIVTDIITNSSCDLVKYEDSMKLHLTLFESLKEFLNSKSSNKYDYYPFT